MSDSNAQNFLSRWWSTRYTILHHLLLALTIASATVFFEQVPQFATIDVATRSLMSLVQTMKVDAQRRETLARGFRPEWNPAVAGDRPLVIIVPNLPAQAAQARLTPTRFAANLIRAAAAQEPAVLAINFDDLDPFFDDPRLNDPQCDYLVQASLEASTLPLPQGPCHAPQDNQPAQQIRTVLDARDIFKQSLASAAQNTHTQVVVKTTPLPLSVLDYDAVADSTDAIGQRVLARRLSWTFDLCQIPNLRVASHVPQNFGGMLFERQIPTLGNLAWQAAQARHHENGLQRVSHGGEVADACAPLRQAPSVRPVGGSLTPRDLHRETRQLMHQIAALHEPAAFGSIGTLNARYFENLANGIFVDVGKLRPGDPVGNIIPRGLHGRVVFIGDDAIRTDVLQFKGSPEVTFNAAVYYSNLHGAIGLKHAFAFIFDVILGAALGWLFAWCWSNYGRARMRMHQVPATSVKGMLVKTPSYLRARGVLMLNLLILVALTGVMLFTADWLLRHDVWINPLPLIIGMSIKGLLASRHMDDEHHAHDWWSFYNQHPDTPFQIVIVVVCIGTLLLAGH